MKSIIGVGNPLTDILAILPDDSLLEKYHLPVGSQTHVDMVTGDRIWHDLQKYEPEYVAGGSAANTVACTAIFGMQSGFVGKIGNDEIGSLFKSDQERYGVKSMLLKGELSSGRSMVFISGKDAERTFATYLGAALELGPDDIDEEMFKDYDYVHLEGYQVQNTALCRKVAELAHASGCTLSLDMAAYNVVEENNEFLHDIVDRYVDIVFANEAESKAFTGMEPYEALEDIARRCRIAVVKLGDEGSLIGDGSGRWFVPARKVQAVDATGAGDSYAGGFIYAHSLGLPLDVCGAVGSIISAKVVEVVGTKIDIPRWKEAKKEIKQLINSRL